MTFALVTANGELEIHRASGHAVWTAWDLPDQAELRRELGRVLGGGVSPVPAPPGSGLACWGADLPALHRPNPVAPALLYRLARGIAAAGAAGTVWAPPRVRGPMALTAWVPGDPVTPSLDARQRRSIEHAHGHAMTGRHAEGPDAC